ncbi:MAG TPA: efflux RND transporter permease subunit, partial [Dehalococcoidia bacterium]|nr:efflux RND transporter permease subunit [Dehalococcoidia bacterium]
MRWIVGSSLKFRYIVIFIAAALVFFGTTQLRDMPVDVFPEFAPPRVEIQTPALGLSAAEVESLVSIPLEEQLTGIPGVDVMRSKSVEQLSSVLLIFEPGTDLMQARQLVQERLATATTNTIPPDVGPPIMLQPLSSTSRFMKIGLTSEEMSLRELSMVAYWKIRARLLGVPGVANVAIWGERLQMLQVQVEPARLRENGVSLEQIMTTTSDALDAGLMQFSDGAVIGTGGFIDTPNQRLQVQHVLPIVTP